MSRLSPESLVDGSEPAEERARREEDEPQNGETKIHSVIGFSGEIRQTRQDV